MDENTRGGLLSQLIPDEIENSLGLGGANDEEEGRSAELLAAALKLAVGSANSALADAIGDFLKGDGSLVEITAAALSRGSKTAVKEVAEFLVKTFHLSEGTAEIAAPLLVKLFPGIKKLTAGSGSKAKPRRKKKTTASSAAKPKAKKKPAASASAKAKKKKPTSAPGAKSTAKPRKPKTQKSKTRSGETPSEG